MRKCNFLPKTKSAEIIASIILTSERSTRSKCFLRCLKNFYDPKNAETQIISAEVVAQLLSQDPEIFGLCLQEETDFLYLVEITKLLIEKMENIDSLQLAFAIVALLLR